MRLDVVSNPETLEGVRYTHDGHTILEKSVTQDTMFQAPSLYRAETKNEDGTSMVRECLCSNEVGKDAIVTFVDQWPHTFL